MTKTVDLAALMSSMTPDQQAAVAALLSQAKAASAVKVTMSVSEKGCLSVRHGSRFPTSLYASQWLRILDHADAIRSYIEANKSTLAWKATD